MDTKLYPMNNPDILDQPNTEVEIDLNPTSVGRRFANYLIDSIVLGAIIRLTDFSGGPVYYYEGYTFNFIGLFSVLASFLVYYTLMEAGFGKTIGKFVTRTKVVTVSGEKPGVGRCLLRSVCRFIPFEPISVLTGTGWHDSISGTIVVNE